MDIDNAEFLEEFMEDMLNHLKIMSDVLAKFKRSSYDDLQTLLNEMFRAAHSIKGMAAAMEFSNMQKLTHKMEDVLYELRDGRIQLSERIVNLLDEGYGFLCRMLESIEESGDEEGTGLNGIDELIHNLTEYSGKKEEVVVAEKTTKSVTASEIYEVVEEKIKEGKIVAGIAVLLDDKTVFKSVRAMIIIKEVCDKSEYIYSYPEKELLEKGSCDVPNNEMIIFTAVEDGTEALEKVMTLQTEVASFVVNDIKNLESVKEIMSINKERSLPIESCEKVEETEEDYTAEILKEIEEKIIDIENDILKIEIFEENFTLINTINEKFQAIEELILMTNLEKLQIMTKKARDIILKMSGKIITIESETIDIILDTLLFIKKICHDIKVLNSKSFIKKFEEHVKNADKLIQQNLVNIEADNRVIGDILKEKLNISGNQIEKLIELQKDKYSGMKLGEIAVRENVATTKDVIDALKIQKSSQIKSNVVKQENAKPGAESAEHENIRIPAVKADNLIDMLEELLVVESQLALEAGRHFSNDSNFIQQMNSMSRIIKDIQNLSISFRMVTLKTLFQKVKISFKDTLKKLDKKVELTIKGEETEIDRIIAGKLLDPMLHLIKNSISHGIEPEEERIAKEKNPVGRVLVDAYCDKGYVYIVIADDGGGINVKRVYEKAREKNLIDLSKNYSEQEIINFIMLPGFSTAESVNEIAGRGVGMDVVKTELSKLGGKIEIENRPGKGCSFILRLPKNMTSLNGTVVTIGNIKYIIPTNYIKEIFKIEEDKYIYSRGVKSRIKLRDSLISIVDTERYFSYGCGNREDKVIVVLEVDNGVIGLPVNNILERREVVVKPIGDEFTGIKHIYGASILGDGKAALILNIENMV